MNQDEIRRQLDQFRRARIAHLLLESALEEVERAILWGEGRQTVALVGPPAVGKTVVAEAFRDRTLSHPDRYPGVALLIKAPANEYDSCDWESWYRAVLRALGTAFLDEVWAGHSGTPPRFSQATRAQRVTMLREAMYDAIREHRPGAIFIDRAARLLVPDAEQNSTQRLLHLCAMAEDTGVPHVALLPYSSLPALLGSWELARRCRIVHLRRYHDQDPADMGEFVRGIDELDRRLPGASPSGLIRHAPFIYERTIGLFGLAKELVIEAWSCAIAADQAGIKLEQLMGAAMTKKQVLRLRNDILEGERRLGMKEQDYRQLRLNLPFPEEDRDDTTEDETGGAKPKPKPAAKLPVGKPKPRRRPIGRQPTGGADGGDGGDEDEHAPESP